MSTIKDLALSLGFDACGIARADALTEDAEFLQRWLAEGHQGDMHYLERNFDKRIDPRLLVPGCKSIVVVLMNYFPSEFQNPSAPQIAKYAYSSIDYHTILKSKLTELEQKVCEFYGSESVNNDVQHVFVDSAPVLERRWAERAGLGWIGKHTQLIHSELGSYTFIGVLILNIVTEYDQPLSPHCGKCTRCIDACPTNALENGSLDARRCISYLTIETKNDIPTEFQSCLSGNILGCDICADICPWNTKRARPHTHEELSHLNKSENAHKDTLTMLDWNLNTWQNLTQESFNTSFNDSAVKRAGYLKLKKNIELVSTNLSIT